MASVCAQCRTPLDERKASMQTRLVNPGCPLVAVGATTAVAYEDRVREVRWTCHHCGHRNSRLVDE